MWLDQVLSWFPQAGAMNVQSAIVLALIFFFASFLLIPRTFLCLAAGASTGPAAIAVILPSTTLGGILAFLLARRFLNARVRRYMDKRPRLYAIADAVDAEGWRLIALLRFASPIPNAIQNYLFGLTRMSLSVYTVTSFVFSVPQVILYVYLGSLGRQVLFDDTLSIINRIVLVLGLMTVAVAAYLVFHRIGSGKLSSLRAIKDTSASAPQNR